MKMTLGLQEWMERFLDYERVHHFSPNTVEAHAKMLGRFRLFCLGLGLAGVRQVTRAVVCNYQACLYHHRKKDGDAMTVAMQKHLLGVVKKFYSFLIREGCVTHNPAGDLELPRDEHRLPKEVLSHEDVERVMGIPDPAKPLGLLNRAVLEVFYSTGIRREELCNLNKADVDRSRGLVRVLHGKGGKDRYVPIGDRALEWVDKWLAEARHRFHPSIHERALFVGTTGNRLRPNRLSAKIHALVKKAGLGKSGSCHLFRHAFATQLMEHGCDIRLIQEMMGHASIETTQIYTHVSVIHLKAAHERCHPARVPKQAVCEPGALLEDGVEPSEKKALTMDDPSWNPKTDQPQ